MPKEILYLRVKQDIIDNRTLDRLQNDLHCDIETCSSWMSLIARLSEKLFKNSASPLVLVDASFLKVKDTDVTETINMISVLIKCFEVKNSMRLGVVIKTIEDLKFIKSIQKTEVLGIVPDEQSFGYNNEYTAVSELLLYHTHWPNSLITLAPLPINTPPGKVDLTSRQQEVLELVCNRGLSNKRIASMLKITESTVKVHISAILKEYGVRNRTQLVLAATSTLRP